MIVDDDDVKCRKYSRPEEHNVDHGQETAGLNYGRSRGSQYGKFKFGQEEYMRRNPLAG